MLLDAKMKSLIQFLQFGLTPLLMFGFALTACSTQGSPQPSPEPAESQQPTEIEPFSATPNAFANAHKRMVSEQIEARGVGDPAVAASTARPSHNPISSP
jgi:hypothetical protein